MTATPTWRLTGRFCPTDLNPEYATLRVTVEPPVVVCGRRPAGAGQVSDTATKGGNVRWRG